MSSDSVQVGGVPALKIEVHAEREVAYDSPDHLMPWGTRIDNSSNRRFVQKIFNLFPPEMVPKVLDMGCSGGGFVKDCQDVGFLAIGVEGSDYSKRFRRAEWRSIPEFLFTCDITGNFKILTAAPNKPLEQIKFDIVTSWEVMEHIHAKDLPTLAANVKKHLAPTGLWIMSIASGPDTIGGVELHQTVKPKAWWIETFKAAGLEHHEEYINYFNTQWVRGPKYGSIGSFHVVVSHAGAKLPPLPKENPLLRLYDLWLGTLPQKFIAGSFIRR